jgi:hypothetical protein
MHLKTKFPVAAELPEGGGYCAVYGDLTLVITRERDRLSVILHDRTKGSLEGRLDAGYAESVAEAKQEAIDQARLHLGMKAPDGQPEWEYFDRPTPNVWA